ncbi:hypothetical protein AGLY_012212 [Aphis glycines]|uniref:Reverse transcriptase domain-containing protein n=1 Tax=Aphis glycines TaxID=307491 RepID=A0A6G0T9F1_APHGL|nr:hypothetical protein AGLY_012212 [Aphis glycines]
MWGSPALLRNWQIGFGVAVAGATMWLKDQHLACARSSLDRLGLRLNASKCATLHLSGRPPIGVRNTQFFLQDTALKSLNEGDATTFLGAQIGFHIIPSKSTIAEITEIGLKILKSKLAPWQRIDALKTFFYPSAVYLLRMGTFQKTDWKEVDKIIRPEIKSTLNLPQEASNEYIYGSSRRGCYGIALLAEDADIVAVDSAFKLLTSTDGRVAREAHDHARDSACRRIGRESTPFEVGSYLSGSCEGAFMESRDTGVASVWSRARNASGRLGVTWSTDGPTAIRHEDKIL